jgi:putative ABC transport system permease protein
MLTKSVIEKIATLPGVRSAAAISYLPMRGRILDLRISISSFQVEGQPAAQPGLEPTADYRVITPGFLKTMGIPLRQGRDFTERDQADSKRVVLINDTMARLYFAKQDPAGRRIRVGSEMREVVGVVADVRMNGLEKSVDPAIYAPFEQDPPQQFSLVVHSASDPLALTAAVRRKILEVDSEQPVADVRTMQQVVDDSLTVRRLATWLLGVFAGLALALAGVGVYGLVSYSVTQRTNEIGLRVALGAQPADILRMVVQRGLVVSVIGVALGLPAAFALAQLIRGLLFGVTAADPMVFVGVPVLLVAVAALASYLPARRAMRIDPTAALRSE